MVVNDVNFFFGIEEFKIFYIIEISLSKKHL